MGIPRAERLVNLVLCLLSTRQYLTAERIRHIVPGYADTGSEEAFYRKFERDKAELRDLGIPLETGRNSAFDGVDGYRIARRDYELADIELASDEAAAVAVASRLWESPELGAAARGALRKLRAAGVRVDDGAPAPVEPRVRAAEPALPALLAAVRAERTVRFDYRKPGETASFVRTVDPWGVVAWRGRWYVVGHDRDRRAARCFRLSRILGSVNTVEPGDDAAFVRPPAGVELLELVTGAEPNAVEPTSVRLWLARGRAQGVRRHAEVLGDRELAGKSGQEVVLELEHPETAAGWLAGYGPDLVVLEPETLSKAVHEAYLATLAAFGGEHDGQ
ncbi:helix-turn-helix transcriptional regulator [Actinopolyspora mortivallis]|uniref:helix-turn-helix transcriptional regulator n=1 Tax=Actinopolyspora mortivallis TaxID=33906 RepID=UPI00036618DD|nr:WYL domain-containing protein [Actinopolyspora mortivallis]